jgi:hypothetical protein
VRSDGRGKGGIPSIDEPTFESASAAADRMVDGEVVFGVVGPDGAKRPPADLPLDRVDGYDAMWFAWTDFYPGTPLYE